MSEMFIFVSFKTANLLLINSQCYKHSENGPAHRVRGGGGYRSLSRMAFSTNMRGYMYNRA